MNSYVNQFQEWLEGYAQTEYGKEIVAVLEQGLETLTDRLQSWLKGDILPNLTSYITRVTDSFSVLFDILKNFGLGMIVAVYLMNGWEKFGAQAKMIVYAIFPKKAAEWIQYEIHYTDRMFSGFIHGKILDSAIVGIICFIFTMVTGMPYALLVSVIVGVTNIIPFFGPYMGMIPSALLILTSSPWKCLVFLVFIILLQQVDGNVLGPRILGETVGISSFWILFSILFFGSIWGLVGMIVGVPLFAVIYDLISRGVSNLLRKRRQETMLDKYTERFHPEKAAVKNKTSGGKAARRKNKTTEDRTNNNQSR
jgi:predicted PurR-regulated permease PerM